MVTHSLRGEGFDASEDGTGRGTPLIALPLPGHHPRTDLDNDTIVVMSSGQANAEIASDEAPIAFDTTQVTHPENRSNPQPGDPCHALAAEGHVPTLAFAEVAEPVAANQARTYTREGNNFRMSNVATTSTSIRRLTPRECERLQGMPDDYTLIPYRGRPAADSPRYKAIGNSMAVPCMRWIGERLEAVHKLVEGK